MKIELSYLVCGTPRSGSSLVCEVLKCSGAAGWPEEYFWRDDVARRMAAWGMQDYGAYVERVLQEGRTENGVFGAKMMWGYLGEVMEKLGTLPAYNGLEGAALLRAVFPGLVCIHIQRRDQLRQAVSFWKAIETNVWAEYDGETPWAVKAPQAKTPQYNFEAICYLRQEIAEHEAGWKKFFAQSGLRVMDVVYEQLVEDPQATQGRLLEFLGVKAVPGWVHAQPRLVRQADEVNEAWMRRFLEDERRQKEVDEADEKTLPG